MKGYVYLDYDKFLVRKDYNYVQEQFPQFFTANKHLIARVWEFNTEDRSCMINMLKGFKDLGVETEQVLLFLKDIDFNIESLKKSHRDADTI